MNCPACKHRNREDSRFCLGCGAPLAVACASCGRALPGNARFCDGCGEPFSFPSGASEESKPEPATGREPPAREPRAYTPRHLAERILESRSALEGERKQVTVLFCDVRRSMELAEELGPEAWHGVLDRFFAILTEGVHRFEGTVNQYTGDGIMALFGAPIAHEDHAQRACFAALNLRDALRELGQELRREHGLEFEARVGLNSGEVIVGRIGDDLRMDYTAQGHTVGLAQRMEQLAEAGVPCLAEATARLVDGYFALDDLGDFNVKGAADPVRVFALEGTGEQHTRLDRSLARGLSRFVGRNAETAQLDAALDHARAGHGGVIGVVAEAGTGKSRLCYEFVERARAAGIDVLEGHALSHGRSLPLRPILQMFRQRFGVTDADDPRAAREKIAGALLLLDPSFAELLPYLFDFLGVPDPERPASTLAPELMQQRIRDAFRRIVHADSRDRPIVSLVEDLHWLDPASESLLAELADLMPQSRGLLLVNFRPEYQADWMQQTAYQQISLAPLDAGAVRELVEDWIGTDSSLAGLAARISDRTGGNPFFAEEVVQALIEDGSLRGARGAYRLDRPIDDVPLPASVQSVLAARIDALAERDKRALQTAAVIGREFTVPLLARLLDIESEELASALATLRRGEFVFETELYPEARYSFKHALTQSVAYGSQLDQARARMHVAVARELERDPQRLDERAAELAWHWDQGGEPLTAARWHDRAAHWVLRRNPAEAARHWHATHDLLAPLELEEDAERLLLDASIQLLISAWQLGMSDLEAREIFERARGIADSRGDLVQLARIYRNYGLSRTSKGWVAECRTLELEATRLADQTPEPGLQADVRFYLVAADVMCGLLDEAARVAAEYFDLAPEDPAWLPEPGMVPPTAFVASWMCEIHAERGELDAARAWQERLGEMLTHVDDPRATVLCGLHRVHMLAWCGEGDAALAITPALLEVAEAYGTPHLRAAALQSLGVAHLARGAWADAAEAFEQQLRLMTEADAFREFEARDHAQLAEALMGRGQPGDLERARELAERGVAIARERGSQTYEIDARLMLARLDAWAGRDVDAALAECARRVEQTGYHLLAPRLHEVRAESAACQGDEARRRAELECARDLWIQMGAPERAARLDA